MGLHTGEAEARAGDYYGPVLNRAARLTAAAHGGQILVTQATDAVLRDRLGDALLNSFFAREPRRATGSFTRSTAMEYFRDAEFCCGVGGGTCVDPLMS